MNNVMKLDEHIKQQEMQAQPDGMGVGDGEVPDAQAGADGSALERIPVYGKDNCGDARQKAAERMPDLWRCLNTKDDLLHLLNVALDGLYGVRSLQITKKQLNRYAYTSLGAKRYTSFKIPKKRQGEFRTIDAPVPLLKYIQRGLNFALQCQHAPHVSAMGFVPHRSVVDNAKVHTGQRLVYNIDLKDFFPSITAGRVHKRLMAKPFSLNSEMASLITDLCCYTNAEGRHVLPQGAPTSPTITNIICERMDRKLSRLAKAYGLKYTRYADDITFSGMANVFYENSRFLKSMRNIIENEEHFAINPDKTRLCHQGMRQEVTGLSVNQRENVSRKYVKQLRTMLHNWEMNGYEKAQSVFAKHYAETKRNNLLLQGTHHIENVIDGKLMFLKMVKGDNDCTYKGLDARFRTLMDHLPAARIHDSEQKNYPPRVVAEIPIASKVGREEFLETIGNLERILNNENNK